MRKSQGVGFGVVIGGRKRRGVFGEFFEVLFELEDFLLLMGMGRVRRSTRRRPIAPRRDRGIGRGG